MLQVHIVLSDRGWILERLAQEIANRYEYVTYSTEINTSVPILYYMTYGTWKQRRIAPVEIGYFAHLEPVGEARDKFFNVASNVDHCICHSQLYENLLREHGVNEVTTVAPGVDIDRFSPEVKIGVVGRTYHTGRKGERLVAEVLDVPNIKWHFTGDGWPYPGLHLADEDMPEFYRSMDYILVPSLYEGGPMCVVEALACGTTVIAPPVGWVSQFPHIEFETGNSTDLRRVLTEVVEQRQKLRQSVLDRTWDNWAAGHDRVFRECYEKLIQQQPSGQIQIAAPSTTDSTLDRLKVALVMHGNEHKSKGGPSVRIPNTAKHLRMQGVEVQAISHPASDISDYDLIHAFNVWNPRSALNLLKTAKSLGKCLVFSSIYLDLAERGGFSGAVVQAFLDSKSPEEIDEKLAALRENKVVGADLYQQRRESIPGYFAKIKKMVELADHVILLSNKERQLLEAAGAELKSSSIVRNPVDVEVFKDADPSLFQTQYNVKDYVLCVGRIEDRKNQLMLVHALRNRNIPIVLVGHSSDKRYFSLIQEIAGENLKIIDRLPPQSEILASAFAGARVFILPSWAEGASLAVLEAAASGANLVLSDRSSESEYFGDYARFCDPGDPKSIEAAVMEAYNNPLSPEQRKQQQAYVEREFSWETYTKNTIEAYKQANENFQASQASISDIASLVKLREPDTLYIDVTTTAHHKGRWTGIARFEYMLAKSFFEQVPYHVKYIVYNSPSRSYLEIPPPHQLTREQLGIVAREQIKSLPDFLSEPEFERDSMVLTMGSAWMQNSNYVYTLLHTCNNNQLRLATVIHDIVPVKFPEWMPSGYAKTFIDHLKSLMQNSDLLLAVSQNTRKDMLEFAQKNGFLIPDIEVFREGDVILEEDSYGQGLESESVLAKLKPDSFVLNVGAIHFRKNPQLLYNIWLRLVDELGKKAPKLVIVGGVAWNSNDFASLLQRNEQLKEFIIVLKNISDRELSWLYRNCMFTVYPSLYEGWGLPVAESLCYGKLCITSNVSSIPEIAPELTKLIDPLDTMAWYNTIKFYAKSKDARRAAEKSIQESYKVTSWSDSASELKSLLKYSENEVRHKQEYYLGTLLDFSNKYQVLPYQAKGWFSCESWGCWSNGSVANLQFKLDSIPSQTVRLEALCGAYVVKNKHPHIFVRVYTNGQHLIDWHFDSDKLQEYYLNIPSDLIDSSGLLNLSFQIFDPTTPRITQGKDDDRELGFKLAKLRLTNPEYHQNSMSNSFEDINCQPLYKLKFTLSLDENVDARLIFVDSFHRENNWRYFALGKSFRLSFFPNELPQSDVSLKLKIKPVCDLEHPLNWRVIVNNCLVGKFVSTKPEISDYRINIPQVVMNLRLPSIIEFQADSVYSPKDLNLDRYNKEFMFGMYSLCLNLPQEDRDRTDNNDIFEPADKNTPYKLGEVLDFTSYSSMRPLLNNTWHSYEWNGVWSDRENASIVLDLDRVSQSDLILFFMAEIADEHNIDKLQLLINDELVEITPFMSYDRLWYRAYISNEKLNQNQQLKVTFNVPLEDYFYRVNNEYCFKKAGVKLIKMIAQTI